ncbi:TetR/AcrR family transcriptional regulator [Agromyces sp. NPDC058110]|uniref:TetR/AcrR family transcriptional regulator n=1 Tax=Agromyces sp. NPDC058110 TaxID=3346345 RepID=UPI0036DDAEB6
MAGVDQETPRHRRTDPDRRDRIIDAALELIATEGVAGISHRKIAAAADVPLGSMTYHFAGMEELLREAFARFATSVSDQIDRRMDAAHDRDSAVDALVEHIEEDIFGSPRELVLTHELYTLAARRPEYRALTAAWMTKSRTSLERYFDPTTTRLLDALVEGLTIHRALDTAPPPPGLAREAVVRILGSTGAERPSS